MLQISNHREFLFYEICVDKILLFLVLQFLLFLNDSYRLIFDTTLFLIDFVEFILQNIFFEIQNYWHDAFKCVFDTHHHRIAKSHVNQIEIKKHQQKLLYINLQNKKYVFLFLFLIRLCFIFIKSLFSILSTNFIEIIVLKLL